MARSTPATQVITRDGLNVNMTAPSADGDIIDAGNVELVINNGSGGPITVTMQTSYTYEGLSLEDDVATVAAGGTRSFGPFPPSLFAQTSDAVVGAGKVLIDYSAVASVTRAVKKLGG